MFLETLKKLFGFSEEPKKTPLIAIDPEYCKAVASKNRLRNYLSKRKNVRGVSLGTDCTGYRIIVSISASGQVDVPKQIDIPKQFEGLKVETKLML